MRAAARTSSGHAGSIARYYAQAAHALIIEVGARAQKRGPHRSAEIPGSATVFQNKFLATSRINGLY